jgi:hypothetical protein
MHPFGEAGLRSGAPHINVGRTPHRIRDSEPFHLIFRRWGFRTTGLCLAGKLRYRTTSTGHSA